jgi:competence ComEA-like helix-hairpin-helix protein
MNDHEQQSGLEADDGPFAEGAKFHWSWHGALIVTLGFLAISLIMKVDLPRMASPPVKLDQAIDRRIDLNTATLAELETLPNIGPLKATRIVDARPFDSVKDLLRVPGMGPKTLEALLPFIRVRAEGSKTD